MKQTQYKDFTISALGHDGFRLEKAEAKLSFAFDPFDVIQAEPVDYIFVTHKHYDHCDPTSIKKLSTSKTKIIAPVHCQSELAEFGDQVIWVADNQKHMLDRLGFTAIPAYNVDKFRSPTEVFHPKELGGVGYIVEAEKVRFYHAGDTDLIPEMENLKRLDVAFLPISGTFVMTLEEAIRAAELLLPKIVIPMHFGKLLGSTAEANRFQNLLRDKLKVEVLSVDSL